MPIRHPHILRRDDTVLLLIDLQAPFLTQITERDRVVARCEFLARACGILGVPTILTVQYAERMGDVIPEIRDAAPDTIGATPLDKLCFSCAGSEPFMDLLRAQNRRQILIGGVETHICVAQTALDLAHRGYQVHVAADAVSSRGMDRHKLGMEKMRDSGITPCAAEQAVYELLEHAEAAEFKQILALVKQSA